MRELITITIEKPTIENILTDGILLTKFKAGTQLNKLMYSWQGRVWEVNFSTRNVEVQLKECEFIVCE